ncbi:MAG: extensin family protein [Polyangiales bacterium]
MASRRRALRLAIALTIATTSTLGIGCLRPRRAARSATTTRTISPTTATTLATTTGSGSAYELLPDPEAAEEPVASASIDTFTSSVPEGTPATIYSALDGDVCATMLRGRGVPFSEVTAGARGVDRPMRLTGPVRGIVYHSGVAPKDRATSPYEIVDCRLLLAIDDLSRILASHGVVEVVHFSMYRPPSAKVKAGDKRSQHEAALAIDLAEMIKGDGSKLNVLNDWHGGIGQKTCGPDAGPSPATAEAKEIRKILCDTATARLFNVMLTPNYNAPHKNHFHLEVTRGVKWFIVH